MGEIKLEDSPRDIVGEETILRMGGEIKEEKRGGSSKASSASPTHGKSRSTSPIKSEEGKGSSVEGDTSDSQKPKLLRAGSSSKVLREKKPPALFNDYPDSTAAATSTFSVIDACIYSNKWIGDSGQDGEVMSCECKEERGKIFFPPRIPPPPPPNSLPPLSSSVIIATINGYFLLRRFFLRFR